MPVFGLAAALTGGHLLPAVSVIIAMGLFNVLGSLQNIDRLDGGRRLRHALLADVTASAASRPAFRLRVPTTIYIGHPGWKALGARAGYSVLNGRS